jgi:DNA-binding SARP family transcriptional activator
VGRLRFRILGALEVEEDGELLAVGGPKLRVVLGTLLARAGALVPVDTLFEVLWGEETPRTARTAVQVHISSLRRLLAADADVEIETQLGGYCLHVEPTMIDAASFVRLSETGCEAAAAGRWQEAVDVLERALSLWRGEPLSDVSISEASIPELADLRDRYATTVEAWAEAMLALGRHAETIRVLERTRGQHPLRERLYLLEAIAMYRSGREGEALEKIAELRRTLSMELGIEPSAAAKSLERQILARDEALEFEQPATPMSREGRKTIVALACITMTEHTLDPEAQRLETASRIGGVTGAVSSRDGTLADRSGSAVIATFGIPKIHEDDAARAVEAALEIRAAIPQVRIGIAAGTVLVRSSGDVETLITTAPLETAKELAEAARASEILISRTAFRLAGTKGAEPTDIVLHRDEGARPSVFRVLESAVGRHESRSPLVGRAEELGALRGALDRIQRRGGCSTVTVLGPAGVGKSRVVSAFLSELRGLPVLVGRCLPYGRDITYWAVAEMVREAAGILEADSPDAARRKLLRVVRERPDAEFIRDCVAAVIGLGDVPARADDIPWAIRKFLEARAAGRLLVLVFEDVHTAESGLLDLVEHLGTAGDRILVVCMARPELLENRPRWGGGRDAMNLVLQPLDEDEGQHLIRNLLGGSASSAEVRATVLRTAEGNPLFIEELITMMMEERTIEWRDGSWYAASQLSQLRMPPSIQALLASRLDRLSSDERVVVEHASVVGREFWPEELDGFPALATLDRGPVLEQLVQKDALRAEGRASGSRMFAFPHLLMRDAAYEGMTKLNRALAHEAFGAIVERRRGARLGEVEEIIGYHFEAAERYRRETGLPEASPSLAIRASRHLAAAGQRAFDREDMPSAEGLLGRALALLGGDDPRRGHLSLNLGIALFELGQLDDADRVMMEGLEIAQRLRDVSTLWRLRMELADLRGWKDDSRGTASMQEVAEQALPPLEAVGDLGGMARAYRLIGDAASRRGHLEKAIGYYERGRSYAEKAGDAREIAQKPNLGVVHSPIPASGCLQLIERNVDPSRPPDPDGLAGLGYVLAMLGQHERVVEVFEEAHERAREIGSKWKAANVWMLQGAAMLIADDPKTAENALRRAVESLELMGERSLLSTAAGLLAEALFRQGDFEQAMLATIVSEQATSHDDVASQMLWLSVRAKVLAVRGELREAEHLARDATQVAMATDYVNMVGDVHLDLAFVLSRAGKLEEAAAAATTAAQLFGSKQNLPRAGRAQEIAAGLREGSIVQLSVS